MKIIYLHQYFITPESSGGTRSYEFAKYLVKMGHEVTIITSCPYNNQNNDWFQTKESGIDIHWLPLKQTEFFNFFFRIKSYLIFALKSYFKIKNIEGDLIFASSTPLTISLPAVFISKKKDIPLVFEVRDLWPDVPIAMKILKNKILIFFAKLLEKWSYKNSHSIIALSPEMKNGIVKKKIETEKIAVIPNSSDIEKFKFDEELAFSFLQKRPWLKNRPLLVYAGAFGKVNDLTYAVNLAKELSNQKSEVAILLIGQGYEEKKLIEYAKSNNILNQNLFFEKPIPKKEMPSCISVATITANFVINIKENWANSANKFFDGLAAGKPILLNHGGWMQDIVLKHNCGLCMHGKKMEIVAKELDSAVKDKNWLKSAGQSSLNLAKTFFDRNIHADQLETVLTLTINHKFKSVSSVTKDYFN